MTTWESLRLGKFFLWISAAEFNFQIISKSAESSPPRVHRLSSRLEPFAASNATTTATGRIGRVCDSITRRGEGMGSPKHRCAAPQRQWFRQGSIPGDAGNPSALDALPSLEPSTDHARWRRACSSRTVHHDDPRNNETQRHHVTVCCDRTLAEVTRLRMKSPDWGRISRLESRVPMRVRVW